MLFKKSKDISSLVEGKNIVLVGPSPHLIGKGKGFLIDEYDVVCRVNGYVVMFGGNDYGYKTDIVFDNFDSRKNDDTLDKMYRYEEEIKKIKLIVANDIQADHETPPNGVKVLSNLKRNNIYNIPYWWIGIENFRYIEINSVKNLNGGIIALILLLLHNPNTLLMTGFSFYLQWDESVGINSIYKPDHIDHRYVKYDWSNWSPEKSHPVKNQIDFFKNNILKKYSHMIKIDSYLKNLLQINYQNVFEV